MAQSNAIPIALNKGLDLTSPALKKEPGALVSCLNYELTSVDGLARIDGYERFDGWANGAIHDILEVPVSVSDGAALAAATAGSIMYLITTQGTVVVGLFVESVTLAVGGTAVRYLPIVKDVSVLRAGDGVILDLGVSADVTASAVSYPLHTTLSLSDYMIYIKAKKDVFRAQVQDSPTPVCGLHWLRNNLLEVRDAPSYTITGVSNTFFNVGDTVKIGTIYGLVIEKQTSPFTVWIEPYIAGASGTSLAVMNKDGTQASTATAASVTEDSSESYWAYMVGMETPETALVKGSRVLYRSVIVEFSNGTQSGGADPKAGDIVNVGPTYGSNDYNLYLKDIVLESGSWAAGTAAGRVELVPASPLNNTFTSGNGAHNKISVGDSVRIGSTQILAATAVLRTKLAGTKSIRAAQTRYVGLTANFYGDNTETECYLTNGAGRAVWAKLYTVSQTTYTVNYPSSLVGKERYYSYGNIYAEALEANDTPMFVSRHGRLCLALGYKGGGVSISVPNEPFNFSGVLGATYSPIGDELTGLLETLGDSTLVFGRRSIGRLSGISDGLSAYTISPDSGALPYTCVNIGRIPVFADQNGVSYLEQSETYSDFIGKRASDNVQVSLRPKLVTRWSDTEVGGIYCAFPIRAKNQYRLILRSGMVYSFCFNGSKPEVCTSNYSNDGVPRLPLALSSQVQDNGDERLHVVWDTYAGKYAPPEIGSSYVALNAKRVYELDSGWGFDGTAFEHYFEVAPLYMDAVANSIGISGVRVFGKSHGIATLRVKARSIETNFDQELTDAEQDISLPYTAPGHYSREMLDRTNIVDHASWGLGVSLRFKSPDELVATDTEPSFVVQVLVINPRLEGKQDA